MFPHRLEPGARYHVSNLPGTTVHYLGNNQGISSVSNKRVKITRGTATAKLLHPDWARGVIDGVGGGCTVTVLPNNAMHINGPLETLQKVRRLISTYHGFFPTLVTHESVCFSEPVTPCPRIEVHPSMVFVQ